MMDTLKKVLKVVAVVVAIAGVAYGVYVAVKKVMDKKKQVSDTEENYVSCSCYDEEFVSDTVA